MTISFKYRSPSVANTVKQDFSMFQFVLTKSKADQHTSHGFLEASNKTVEWRLPPSNGLGPCGLNSTDSGKLLGTNVFIKGGKSSPGWKKPVVQEKWAKVPAILVSVTITSRSLTGRVPGYLICITFLAETVDL